MTAKFYHTALLILAASCLPCRMLAQSPATMTSPSIGFTLSGPSQTFIWSAGSGAYEYFLYAGSSQGGNNYFGGSTGTSRSWTVGGLPTNGTTVYVRLWTRLSNGWSFNDYSFRAATAMAPATMNSPSSGSTLSGSSQAFSWNTGSGALEYFLYVGNSQGGNNYFGGSTGTSRSQTVGGLPTDGSTIYVRLWSRFSNGWNYNDYTYRAATVVAQSKAVMVTPSTGSTLNGASQTFAWSAGSGALEYYFQLGSSQGAANYFNNSIGTSRNQTVNGLPTNGSIVYARLWTRFANSWDYNDYSFRAANVIVQTKAAMSAPASGATLASTSQTFSWSAGSGALEYFLFVGSSPGSSNYFGASTGTGLSRSVSGLPTNGSTIHVRLQTRFATGSAFNDYTFVAASPKVLLFLHGMNSSPAGAWDSARSGLSLGTMPVIKNGLATGIATPDLKGKGVLSYAVAFGSFDTPAAGGRTGLEKITGSSNYATSGDFETFDQLGSEVDSAVTWIRNQHSGASIVLVGHSRGGLAGRAFLQQAASSANKAAIKGFVTTGTPHRGSRLARIYSWLLQHPRDPKKTSDDWKVVDFARNPFGLFNGVDVRRPTIDDLSDGSDLASYWNPITKLNSSAGNLPGWVTYYGLAYNGYSLGRLDYAYNLFDYSGSYQYGPQVSSACRDYLLGQGNSPGNFTGDGIVPASSQAFLNKSGSTFNRNILHTEESKQSADLLDAINAVCPWFK